MRFLRETPKPALAADGLALVFAIFAFGNSRLRRFASLRPDITILFKTIGIRIKGDGAY